MTVITTARSSDLDAIERLLRHHGLPIDGLTAHVGSMVVARDNDRIVGSAAIEPYEEGVLLRSVAVDPSLQGTGVGARLTEAALAMARDRRATAAYLLTTTAEAYFTRHGFTRIDRADVPRSVQQSIEFQSACPASATAMRRSL
jgi:amino-acid N-acetyltransferase